MKTGFAFGLLLAVLAMVAPPSRADAQSRGNLGGYSSGAAIGGATVGGGPSPGSLGSPPAITRAAPVARPSLPPLPADRPPIPRLGMSGYYNNAIGTVPPGNYVTTVKPR